MLKWKHAGCVFSAADLYSSCFSKSPSPALALPSVTAASLHGQNPLPVTGTAAVLLQTDTFLLKPFSHSLLNPLQRAVATWYSRAPSHAAQSAICIYIYPKGFIEGLFKISSLRKLCVIIIIKLGQQASMCAFYSERK